MKSFDGLKNLLGAIVLDGETNAKNLIEKLLENKANLNPELFDFLVSEINSMEGGFKEILDAANILYRRAISDPIGLFSKDYMGDEISILEKNPYLAFLMGDVDKFKPYNDTYGHLQGDVALRYIAGQFKKSIENMLVGDEASFIARHGGEEFCAFIRNYQRDISALSQIAEGAGA